MRTLKSMDTTALVLARLQFGITLTYHFSFVALTLGLSVLIALTEARFVLAGDPDAKIMAKFWGRLFLLNYAVGVVTGLVNEFQFGMNWAEYSRFVGSVFGPPLAFEALTAFFVESVAIGVWAYGWDKISPRAHLAMIILIAAAANYSAFWILAANAFMQHPAGHVLAGGRLELADLAALVANPYLRHQYGHTVLAAFAVTGFFVMAVSARYLLRRRSLALFGPAYRLGLWCALLASGLVAVSGHYYTQYLAAVQPMKLAAAEALWETAEPAPFVVVALIDEQGRRNTSQLAFPAGLSVLAYNSVVAPVRGINDLQDEFAARHGPGRYIPAVTVLFWAFRVMVASGLLLLFLPALNLWYLRKGPPEAYPGFLRAAVLSLPLPYLAIVAGWLVAEMGRQPWLVYGLQLTGDGLSRTVPAAAVWASLLTYTVLYAAVAAAAGRAAAGILRAGPGDG